MPEFSSWGEWFYEEGSRCSDSCGTKGTQEMTRTRECLTRSSSGITQCTGERQQFKKDQCQHKMPKCGGIKNEQLAFLLSFIFILFPAYQSINQSFYATRPLIL